MLPTMASSLQQDTEVSHHPPSLFTIKLSLTETCSVFYKSTGAEAEHRAGKWPTGQIYLDLPPLKMSSQRLKGWLWVSTPAADWPEVNPQAPHEKGENWLQNVLLWHTQTHCGVCTRSHNTEVRGRNKWSGILKALHRVIFIVLEKSCEKKSFTVVCFSWVYSWSWPHSHPPDFFLHLLLLVFSTWDSLISVS